MNTKNDSFSWSDAWVYTSLCMILKADNSLDLSMLIGCADMLNHSILLKDEINCAFTKFVQYQLISVNENKISLTALGNEIYNKSEKVKGGMFSRVDITLRKLNSKQSGIEATPIQSIIEYFNEKQIMDGYNIYISKAK